MDNFLNFVTVVYELLHIRLFIKKKSISGNTKEVIISISAITFTNTIYKYDTKSPLEHSDYDGAIIFFPLASLIFDKL